MQQGRRTGDATTLFSQSGSAQNICSPIENRVASPNSNEKKVSRSTATIAICGIKFFYEQTMQRGWSTLNFVRPPRTRKLPVVLSREEVRLALAAVRIPAYRACLTTIYACGLRANEGAHLQVEDVDSSRMFLRIIQGKGNQDRYVPLPEPTLHMLRAYRQTHRSRPWLFPAPANARRDHGLTSGNSPVDRGCLHAAFKRAVFSLAFQTFRWRLIRLAL